MRGISRASTHKVWNSNLVIMLITLSSLSDEMEINKRISME